MRRTIDIGTLLDLIAAGLPEFILNRIDREALLDTVDLFNEVSKFEHMVNKRNFVAKGKYGNPRAQTKNEDKIPCKICEKLNKGNRYHSGSSCWFRTKEDDKWKKMLSNMLTIR